MIEVRFYGLIRLESGVKQLKLEASSIRELCDRLKADYPALADDLKNSIVLINGKRTGFRAQLRDGDVVQFLSPSAGG